MVILQTLTRWSDSIPNFEEFYSSFLFTLLFRKSLGPGHLTCDITEMRELSAPVDPAGPSHHITTRLGFKVAVKLN